MLLSIDDTFKYWLPWMKKALGRERALLACERMRPYIERARKAEIDRKIAFMQPETLSCNTKESLDRGCFNLAFYYQPVVDGMLEKPQRRVVSILKEEDHEISPAPKEREAVEG